jgi:hypothetical protein
MLRNNPRIGFEGLRKSKKADVMKFGEFFQLHAHYTSWEFLVSLITKSG